MLLVMVALISILVALRKESVDRNFYHFFTFCYVKVALRKESVDRNILLLPPTLAGARSLSARRAWIEILEHLRRAYYMLVALRKESVDRNIPSH